MAVFGIDYRITDIADLEDRAILAHGASGAPCGIPSLRVSVLGCIPSHSMLKRLFLACILLSSFALADDDGHSKHGTAFDSGMRTKPWKMEGIGDTPFPITSKNKEVQQWFNQGVELLQSFWFEEAERSFRWCL